MARESKVETEVRESISKYLAPYETLREFTWGTKGDSVSAAYFWFGAIGASLAKDNQLSFLIGLTDKRLILIEVNGKMPTGEVYSISTSDIKGLRYRNRGTTGNLNVHLSADVLQLTLEKRPWWKRAKEMARLMPL